MARNLLAEHRLSEERFLEFSGAALHLSSISEIQAAIVNYQSAQVRPLKGTLPPAYARSNNRDNLVHLPADTHLGNILDLTRLGRIYADAWPVFRMPQFETYAVTNPRSTAEINDFLSSRLGDPRKRESFLKGIFRAMTLYREKREKCIQPIWAAEWDSLHPLLLPDEPLSWLEAVGVPRDNPVWVAVLCYPVKNLSREITTYRPTQLDAGWYAHHFPSPPQAPLAKGGHTMFLDAEDGRELAPPPVSEYVHEQVDFSIEDWIAGGSLVGVTGGPTKGTLDRQRHRHLTFLQTVYGKEVSVWMSSGI